MPHAKRGDTAPPKAAKRPHESHAHGVTWRDDYAWIRAENWREVLRDPSAIAAGYPRAARGGERLCRGDARPDAQLAEQLVREMRARLRGGRQRVPPAPDGPYAYYSRFRHGGQHRIYCRRPRSGGKETILLDGDARARAKRSSISAPPAIRPTIASSPGARTTRARKCTRSRVRDVAGETDLADRVENATRRSRLDARFRARSSMSLRTTSHRPWRVMLHRLGTPSSEDVDIFEEARSRLVHRHRADAARPPRRSLPSTATTPRKRRSSISTTRPRRRA